MLLKKAMCAIDMLALIRSDMARKSIQANMALMGILEILRSEEFKEPESNNSKENTDDSLEQHQMTDTPQTRLLESPT
ncbi:hypothetical protein Tco_1540380 [Tanacetum coccineum]